MNALCTLIVLLLFHAQAVLAASGDAAEGGPQSAPLTPVSPLTPALSLQGRGGEKDQGRGSAEAPPEPCRDCAGVQYFRPSATLDQLTPLTPGSLTPALSQGERECGGSV